MNALDSTHDPERRAWVPSAQAPDSDFPIQNLPLGVFSRGGATPRGGVAIGDQILDLRAALDAGLVSGPAAEAAAEPGLNRLMAMGRGASRDLRRQVSDLLAEGSAAADQAQALLVPMGEAQMHLPCTIANFSDFMVSRDHSWRLGALKDALAPLPPAFDSLPVAYHSRASSVRVSGEPVVRPNGQWKRREGVHFGPTEALDFELELAIWLAGENALGTPVPMSRAPERLFGYGLLNDWSARDIQRWEMPPLGPFLAKSLSTSVSPWIVTAEALLPFAIPSAERGEGVQPPLPYLDSTENRARGGLSIAMEVWLLTPRMKAAGGGPARLTATDFATMAWTPAQMVTHHASNGCNLLPGDLLGSGTCSGPGEGSEACMAELILRGPIELPNGETRRFLEDGDEVIFRARAHAPGAASIGFGECRAVILPAPPWPAE
ncbi:fumarylacetoacetase [Roseomonas sp. SSH11]|uniref:fumarylacetoacetase n=1 Tax=Pararoseomonas baculiformis TaxID=2820812 RepID=A0ABS4AHN6_9PROT|nr:fumarylacetoacetase [Pararoseomonas baculiformis]MBP0446510.1 fumarylacetoacetase [Pararoseomonas baculiformis]